MKYTRLPALILLILLCLASSSAVFATEGSFAEHKKVSSDFLSMPHNVTVYLPPGYNDDANTNKRYPVLYAHDGQNLFHKKAAFGGNEWRLDENAEALMAEGLLPPIIIVGIHNNAKRIDEYTPTHIKAGQNKYLKNGGGGELRQYARFIVEKLKPFIDRTYRSKRGRANTGVMGSSLGGIASLYILGWHPETFSRAACISPSFWWDSQTVFRDLDKLQFPPDVRIYLDGGWKEGADESSMITYMRTVYEKLQERKLGDFSNLLYYEDPDGIHSESAWAKRGRWPLLFLFGSFKSHVKSLKLHIRPPKIGVGDSSAIFAEAVFKNGSRATRYRRGFSITPKSTAQLVEPGILKGMQAGPLTVRFTMAGESVHRKMTVSKFSRDRIVMKIKITSPDPVKKLYFHILKKNGEKSDTKLPLKMLSDTHGELTYLGKNGNMIRFQIVDGQGRKALAPTGKILRPILSVSRNRTIRLKVFRWQ